MSIFIPRGEERPQLLILPRNRFLLTAVRAAQLAEKVLTERGLRGKK